MKKVLCFCNSGSATSALLAQRLENIFKDEGIEFEVIVTSHQELTKYAGQPFTFAATVIANFQSEIDLGFPVFKGAGYAMGRFGDDLEKMRTLLKG
ncbi:MAG: hypothetical protein ACRCWI_02720 [Brevinema sp.]